MGLSFLSFNGFTTREMFSFPPTSLTSTTTAGSEASAQSVGRDKRRSRVLQDTHALRQEVPIALEAAKLKVPFVN